jgi:hypothetical protein
VAPYIQNVLGVLTVRLQNRLRTVQAECSAEQLQDAIARAVQAYSERRPLHRPLTLVWDAGQADVELPYDWILMEPESWAKATQAQAPAEPPLYDGMGYGRLGSGALRPAMPMPEAANYTFRIYPGYPGTVRISPEPSRPVTVKCDYFGAHEVGDETGVTTVPQPDWDLIVLRAVYETWADISHERGARPVQFEASGDGAGQRIRMADPDKLREMAERDNAEFIRRTSSGPFGVMG